MRLQLDRRTVIARSAVALVGAFLLLFVAPPDDAWAFAGVGLVLLWLIPVRAAVAATCGLVLSVITPPLGLSWLHWVAYLPMFWALRAGERRTNMRLGYLFGVVSVYFVFVWLCDTIIIFSNIPAVAAYGLMVLFAVVYGAPYVITWGLVHPLRRRAGGLWIVLLPTVQVLVEFASMWILLFPYNLGATQYRVPGLVQIASITGVIGLTWLLFFVNAALAEAIYRRREGRPFPTRWVAFAVAVVAAVFSWGTWRHHHLEAQLAEAPVLRVAQMQSHLSMQEVIRRRHRSMLRTWIRKTDAIEPGSADLVVWPEGAGPHNPSEWRTYGPKIAQQARDGGWEMVIGGGWWDVETDVRTGESRPVAFNSIFVMRDDGRVYGRYDKLVPVPFGEYIPFGETFPWLRDMIEGPGNFRKGQVAVVLEGDEQRYATPICYEAILPRTCRRFDQPTLLVNVTNDAWFGDTAGPHQHAMLSTFRATELGIPLVRSGYTGVSMVVEPHGRIHSETEPFTEVNRVVPVRMARFPTVYARFGDWFVLLCAVGLALAWVLIPWRRRRQEEADQAATADEDSVD